MMEERIEDRISLLNALSIYKNVQSSRLALTVRLINILRDKVAPNLSDFPDLKWGNDVLTLLQKKKYKAIAEGMIKAKIPTPDFLENIVLIIRQKRKEELKLLRELDKITQQHPFRIYYLDHVVGLSSVSFAYILGYLAPLDRFANPSKLFKYCGWAFDMICQNCNKLYLKPETRIEWEKRLKEANKEPSKFICSCKNPQIKYVPQKKRKNMLITFNDTLKQGFYNIAENFIKLKAKSYYGQRYDVYKIEGLEKYPDYPAWRVRYYAIRKTIREFLYHLWVMWHYVMLGKEPPCGLYAQDILEHSEITPPVVDVNGVVKFNNIDEFKEWLSHLNIGK